jgi:hypothetical protein
VTALATSTRIPSNPTALGLAAALLLTGLAGCVAERAPQRGGDAPVPRLAATLVSPADITLNWQGVDPNAAGQIVEFATEPDGTYTILEFVPPSQTTFTHPDLMPETPVYYRVRTYLGPASTPLEVVLPPGELDEESEKDDHGWAEPRTAAGEPVATRPIRDPGTAAAGAPTELRATVKHANGIAFTWTDHASDEEGYLLEVRPESGAEFRAAVVLDPDINSVGLITLPTEKKATYRVRAFHYGAPSTVAHQTTGRPPGPS